jgi:hypothetical protein
MASDWVVEPPYLRCTFDSGDALLVLLGGDHADDLSAPCDFTVRRETGVRLMGTAATTAHLDAILKRWQTTGEGNSGGYIGLAHYLVLAVPTVDCLRDAVEDLLADDALANVLEVVTEAEWTP